MITSLVEILYIPGRNDLLTGNTNKTSRPVLQIELPGAVNTAPEIKKPSSCLFLLQEKTAPAMGTPMRYYPWYHNLLLRSVYQYELTHGYPPSYLFSIASTYTGGISPAPRVSWDTTCGHNVCICIPAILST
jgi:hypothetical protein